MAGLPDLEAVDDDDDIKSGNEDVSEAEPEAEDDETELCKFLSVLSVSKLNISLSSRLMKKWDAPVYAFFKPMPEIEYIDGRKAHVFACAASCCRCKSRLVHCFLYTRDSSSTSNLHHHAKVCWGEEAVTAANNTGNAPTARDAMSNLKDGSITAAFERAGKGKVTYSHRQHTKPEARAEFVRWVAESKWPFQIVNNRAFCSLMKMGRPEAYIPSAETVSRDIKNVFVHVCERIAKMLQEHDGKLSFTTDAWTSPNHKAYVAITVHLEHEGKPLTMLLDLVEVAKSHTGVNLAAAFAEVLEAFGIDTKVSQFISESKGIDNSLIVARFSVLPPTMPPTTIR
ncbi:hypothetical protein CVT26_001761 [Gymnopilus dilepis]|uniref:DUF659 domain-containing protein n=1 Tax=Gymnopilus dilepis TaxID=231916 RepID=A0A409WE58_9AGAR|nr:hypothetical protein CVT26_001761 [Gymnopilus dilepis]